jgi:hypothetical protein
MNLGSLRLCGPVRLVIVGNRNTITIGGNFLMKLPFDAELGSAIASAISPLASVTIAHVSCAISFALSPALNGM